MTSFQENGMEFNWFIFVYMSSLDKLEHFIFNYFFVQFLPRRILPNSAGKLDFDIRLRQMYRAMPGWSP